MQPLSSSKTPLSVFVNKGLLEQKKKKEAGFEIVSIWMTYVHLIKSILDF